MMSSFTSNSTSTTSKPSTDPEATRTTAQTEYRHHSIPILDEVKCAQGTNNNSTGRIEADVSADSEYQNKDTSAASLEQVAHRSTN